MPAMAGALLFQAASHQHSTQQRTSCALIRMTAHSIVNHRAQLFRSGIVLAASQAVNQTCVFIRNLIVARVVGPADFGIAATFAITMSVLQMISHLAVDRLLVQADEGDDPCFQRTAHLFMALRGLLLAGVIFLLAHPIALLFGIPETTWAFRCLALVPLLRGFVHLESKRLHRQMRFGRDATIDVLDQLVPTLAAWPLAHWLGDYSAILWLVLLQAATTLIVSHLVAGQHYAWTLDKRYARRMLSFGWPLLVDGLLMFGIFQGDRLIVGMAYSMTDLGVYAIAFGLALLPAIMITRITSSLMLPSLSRVQHNPQRFQQRFVLGLQFMSMIAALLAAGLIVIGPQLIVLLYGSAYAAAGELIGVLAVMNAVRLMRVVPILAAMARANTRLALLSNVARTSSLIAAAAVALAGGELVWIALTGVCGEVLAGITAIVRLKQCHRISASLSVRPALLVTTIIAAAYGLHWASASYAGWMVIVGAAVGLAALTVAAAITLYPELRAELFRAAAAAWQYVSLPFVRVPQ